MIWRQSPRRPRYSAPDPSRLDRLDGVTDPNRDVIAAAEAAIREAVVQHHVKHLVVACMWQMNRGRGRHTILAFLDSPETRRIYCPEAVAVVATLVGGGSR